LLIRHPTALYKPIIPQDVEVGGNVTYTISMNEPRRAIQTIVRLPTSIELRKKSDTSLTTLQRRNHVGKLAFTVSKTNSVYINSGKKQFEVGQVLEFEQNTDYPVDPMYVGNILEVQHDTNMLDITGLDDAERVATSQLDLLNQQLSSVRMVRSQSEVVIRELYKQLNETRKALKAVEQLVVYDDTLSQTANVLRDKITTIESSIQGNVAIANLAAQDASELADKIRSIAQLVR